jgi:Kef-type K+ transport system membrane component KefB
MTPFLQLAISLAVIITAAKIGGYLSVRLNQPAVLGELLVGIFLGPTIVDLLHLSLFTDAHLPEVIREMAEIGVLLLMFLAGQELHINDLLHSGKVAGLAGTLGVAFPLLLGLGAGLAFHMPWNSAVFLGLTLAATSVSISAQTLMELKVIRSRVGAGLLGAAVFDDVLVILGLAVFTALADPGTGGGALGIALVLLKMILYIGGASLVGWWLFPRMVHRIHAQPISQGLVAFVFVTILVYAWLAETAGNMAAITGAFLAGLWLGRTPLKERIHTGIGTIAYGIFVPVFFINIGLSANIRDLRAETLGLFAVLVVVALLGKVLGAGWGARLAGLTALESLQLGVGMISRGEVGLIVAAVGVGNGYLSARVFSAVVGIVILTTVLTPLLLRLLIHRPSKALAAQKGSST